MLDRLVEELTLQEEMLNAGREPPLVDIERHMAQVAAERRPPHEDGCRRGDRQSEREAVRSRQRAPAGLRPAPSKIDRMDDGQQREERSRAGQPRPADACHADDQRGGQRNLQPSEWPDGSHPGGQGSGAGGGCQRRQGTDHQGLSKLGPAKAGHHRDRSG